MKIVVTGGAGFVGSAYVRNLIGGAYPRFTDADVHVVDKMTYAGNKENLAPVLNSSRLQFVPGDICDEDVLTEVLAGADAVVHFAAESHVDRSFDDPPEFMRTNAFGTAVLLEGARRAGVRRFVHVSTDEVYGSVPTGASDEAYPIQPNSPYAASKAAADLMVLAYARCFGVDACITRSANTYGPYQYPEKIIPSFVTRMLDGGTVPLYGDGGQIRNWLHVDDHCRAVQLVLQRGRPGEVYNIGGVEFTNRELIARLLDACGADWSRVVSVRDRPASDRRYSVDFGKIRGELGFSPQVPFDQGLADTVAWYRSHRSWWQAGYSS